MNGYNFDNNIENNLKSCNCPSTVVKFSGVNEPVEREVEALLALGNGFIGTRNSLEEYRYDFSDPATFIAGLYKYNEIDSVQELIKLPDWTRFNIFVEDHPINLYTVKTLDNSRYLDFKRGVLSRSWKFEDDFGRVSKIQIVKFISFKNKSLAFKSLSFQPINYCGKVRIQSLISFNGFDQNSFSAYDENKCSFLLYNDFGLSYIIGQKSYFRSHKRFDGIVPLPLYQKVFSENQIYEQWEWSARFDHKYSIISLHSFHSNVDNPNFEQDCKTCIDSLSADSIEKHIEEWKSIWDISHFKIYGNSDAQRWLNFAIYHLVIAAKFSGNKYSIPARTLTGEAYLGHIFWDTEIYLLPYYILTNPDIARNLLMYRYNTLDGARKNAESEGYKGASYAWESTDSGEESTPTEVILPSGEVINIYSGQYENHISADIAYCVWNYYCATEDIEFLSKYGSEIIFETARFCASHCSKESDGLYHIKNVEGPDEYHEIVNDNAFTNVMAQHNFEIALKVFDLLNQTNQESLNSLSDKISLKKEELSKWEEIKNYIYIPYDENTEVFEQFDGYFDLEDINIYDYEPRQVAMDILLGREKTAKSKVIKQPDVLMFMFLLKNKFSKNQILKNFEYYEPKTGHGSSLSPSVYSIIASWVGKMDLAYSYFKKNAGIDLGPDLGTAAGGIHIAAQGGLWMSVVFGFAGIAFEEQILTIDPNIPDQWRGLEFCLLWRGQKLLFTFTGNRLILLLLGDSKIEVKFKDEVVKSLYPEQEISWILKDEGSNYDSVE